MCARGLKLVEVEAEEQQQQVVSTGIYLCMDWLYANAYVLVFCAYLIAYLLFYVVNNRMGVSNSI